MTAFVPVYLSGDLVDYAWVDEVDAPLLADYRWLHLGRHHAVSSGRTSKSVPPMKSIAMHRFLLGLEPGDGVVHHINEDPLDNRRANLKWLPDLLAHGVEPHPRRDLRCTPGHGPLPPHERQVALAQFMTEAAA